MSAPGLKVWWKMIIGWKYKQVKRRDDILDVPVYKRNPDYQQFKRGQLVINGYNDIFRATRDMKGSDFYLPTEAELRELVPQVYEQFVKELEDVKHSPYDTNICINDLINKHKGNE